MQLFGSFKLWIFGFVISLKFLLLILDFKEFVLFLLDWLIGRCGQEGVFFFQKFELALQLFGFVFWGSRFERKLLIFVSNHLYSLLMCFYSWLKLPAFPQQRIVLWRQLFNHFLLIKKRTDQFLNLDVKHGILNQTFLNFRMNVGIMIADQQIQLLSQVFDLAL